MILHPFQRPRRLPWVEIGIVAVVLIIFGLWLTACTFDRLNVVNIERIEIKQAESRPVEKP